MSRHRIIKPKGKISQILFKIGGAVVDFCNNIVTDDGGAGVNASLSGNTYALRPAYEDAPMISNAMDYNGDWTIFVKIKNGDNFTAINENVDLFANEAAGNGEFNIRIRAYQNSALLLVNDAGFGNFGGSGGELEEVLYAVRKVGSTYSLFRGGVLRQTLTNTYTFTRTGLYCNSNRAASLVYFHSIFNEYLSDAEISNVTDTCYVISLFKAKANVANRLWIYNNGQNTVYDRGAGIEATLNVGTVYEQTEAEYSQQAEGFQIYTNNTDTSIKIYLPINLITGVSFGKVVAGYTSGDVVEQRGSDFLNNGDLLDNTGAASFNSFWSTARTYEEIQLENSISKVQGTNKLNKITTNV